MSSGPVPALTLLLALAEGCAGAPAEGDDTAADSGDSADTAPDSGDTADTGDTAAPAGRILVDAAHNYTWTATLTPTLQVAASGAEAWVDWTGLTHDLLGRELDPTEDVREVMLGRVLHHDAASLAEALVMGTLVQEDVEAVYTVVADPSAKAPLSAFRYVGMPLNPADDFVEGDALWVLAAIPGGRPGVHTLGFVEPRVDAPVTDLVLDDTTATFAFDATLAPPLVAPAVGPWSLDWSALGVGATGRPLEETPLDTLWLGRFDGLDAAALEAQLLVAESLATEVWSLRISGADHVDDLAALVDKDGAPFPGFEADALYGLVLRCTTCIAPAPPFVGLLTVEIP